MYVVCTHLNRFVGAIIMLHSRYHYFIEAREDIRKVSPFDFWRSNTNNIQWLELPMAQKMFEPLKFERIKKQILIFESAL